MDFTLTATQVIHATPAQVFDRVTDIARLPEWNKEVGRIIECPSALAAGAEWVVEIRAMGTHWNSRSTVVDLDPERGHFAYISRSDDGNPSHADWTWDLTPDPAGTLVRVQVAAHPLTRFRRMVASRIRPSGLRKAMETSLRALDQELTRHPAPDAATTNTKEHR